MFLSAAAVSKVCFALKFILLLIFMATSTHDPYDIDGAGREDLVDVAAWAGKVGLYEPGASLAVRQKAARWCTRHLGGCDFFSPRRGTYLATKKRLDEAWAQHTNKQKDNKRKKMSAAKQLQIWNIVLAAENRARKAKGLLPLDIDARYAFYASPEARKQIDELCAEAKIAPAYPKEAPPANVKRPTTVPPKPRVSRG